MTESTRVLPDLLQGAKVLLVDDMPANLDVLCSLLETAGYDLALAADGELALTLAQRLRPDLILLDIMMPDMDGFEVCRRLQADRSLCDTPVIFITALGSTEDVVTGLRLGGVDYITKPFRDEEVLARVQTQLHLGRLRRVLDDRRRAFEQQNHELRDVLQELQSTQNQLLLREKMASLGHLAAGITHEINNSLAAELSAVDVARRCVERLGSGKDDRLLRTLTANLEIASNAGERIAEVVGNLKTFAGLDDEDCVAADVNKGIDSVLTLMQQSFDGRIEIVRDRQSTPLVACPPGQLNHVFHSLLKNAVSAIDGTGSIRVATLADDGHVLVSIDDSGCGIAPERLDGLFDFGFSRDGPRVRMTSGLSTSCAIVQRFGGELLIESDLGVGSRVRVRLPVAGVDAR